MKLYRGVFHLFMLIIVANFGIYTKGYATDSQTLFKIEADSVDNDTLKTVPDSTQASSSSTFQSKVDYKSNDSIKYDIQNEMVYLWGEAEVKYEDLTLTADYIEIDMQTNLVYASGLPDSTGTIQGKPKFIEAGKEYDADEMTYNFTTQKGKILAARTQEGDGYVLGQQIKKQNDGVIFVKNGRYTTCNLENPHFHIQAGKLKVIQNDKIVTGPANLWISDIPTPLAVPFGFFPNRSERSSGILIPAYGNSPGLGYFLENGGFYIGESENWDMELRGDVYTNGSWSTNSSLRYNQRYKHSGNLNFEYSDIRRGDPEAADFSRSSTFFVRWTHRQDRKARPNSNFSANVNAGSANNFTNNFNTNARDYLQPNFKSSINYTQRIGEKFNLALSANQDQNRADSTMSLVLPQATFTMSRIFPFKSLNQKPGKKRFYEDIGISYTMDFRNRLNTREEDLFTQKSIDNLQNGVRHSIPLSTSFKILKHFTLNPSINYGETWYFESIRQSYNSSENQLDTTTIGGLQRWNEVSMNAGLSTKIYGMYMMKFSRIKAIRHVVTPNVSFSYRPDLSDRYYEEVQVDSTGDAQRYSYFAGGIYGTPVSRQTGTVNFNLINNFEAKYKTKSDTTDELKKIKLLENLSFGTNYNIYADSLNWSAINFNGRTNFGQNLSFQFNGTLDPYAANASGRRINELAMDVNGTYLRLTRASAAFNLRLKSKQRTGDKETVDEAGERVSKYGTAEQLEYINANPEAYIDFSIPWSLNFNYNITYTPNFDESAVDPRELVNTLNFSGDFSLTENWKVEFRSGYDFEQNDLSYTSLNIHRDLHCWQMNFSVIPFGPRQSYTFDINVKAPVLQDLKLQRRRSWFDQ